MHYNCLIVDDEFLMAGLISFYIRAHGTFSAYDSIL